MPLLCFFLNFLLLPPNSHPSPQGTLISGTILTPGKKKVVKAFLYINCNIDYVPAKLLQWCPTLWDPMEYSPPGASVHGILQARILEGVAMPSSRGSSWPRDETRVSCISCTAGRFFTTEPPGKPNIDCTHPHTHAHTHTHTHTHIWVSLVAKWLRICLQLLGNCNLQK